MILATLSSNMRTYSHTELVAWQRAMDLAVAIYGTSRVLPRDERYGLTTQMRRGAVSISANIGEGQGRRTCGECLNCLSIAYGSLGERETHLMLAERLNFIEPDMVRGILERTAEVGRLINGLARSLKS